MVLDEVRGGRVTERHVQAIWYDAALRPASLRTRGGLELRVVSPGAWNLGPGPDFIGAVLEVGKSRRRVVGDVEVHLRPADWDAHGHGRDPRYRGVVAHVVWGCGPVPASLPPGALSVWLGRFVLADPEFSPLCVDLSAYPYARLPEDPRPCGGSVGADPAVAEKVLAAAGRRRLALKARLMAERIEASRRGEYQVYYEETMAALGYSANAERFRSVARRLPVRNLPREADSARTAMLVAGGFEDWDRSRQRPSNSPEVRLAAAADLFVSGEYPSFAASSDFSRASCIAMLRAMCLGGRIGRGRAAAVMANVVLPFALASGRVREIPDWLPPEDISAPVRLMAFRLFGRDHNPARAYAGNGLLVQGLIQILRETCLPRHPDCAPCPLAIPYTT